MQADIQSWKEVSFTNYLTKIVTHKIIYFIGIYLSVRLPVNLSV